MSFHTLVYHEVRKDEELDSNKGLQLLSQNNYNIEFPRALYVTENQFEQQMNFLMSEDYHFLKMTEVQKFYEEGLELPDKSILITFDDAYQSTYYNAYPILKRRGIPSLLFLVSSWVFDDSSEFDPSYSKVMSWQQIDAMKDVFELANHTHNLHNRVGSAANGVMSSNIDQLALDLVRCNQFVDYGDTFAYPFGFYDKESITQLNELGMKYAFTTQEGINTNETYPMTLNRLLVHQSMSIENFRNYLENNTEKNYEFLY